MAKKKEDLGGVWRTVGGRRIFIKDGQDLYEAMNDSGKFTNLKKENFKRKKNDLNKGDVFVNKNRVKVEIVDIDEKGNTLRKMVQPDGKEDFKNFNEKDVKSMLDQNGYKKETSYEKETPKSPANARIERFEKSWKWGEEHFRDYIEELERDVERYENAFGEHYYRGGSEDTLVIDGNAISYKTLNEMQEDLVEAKKFLNEKVTSAKETPKSPYQDKFDDYAKQGDNFFNDYVKELEREKRNLENSIAQQEEEADEMDEPYMSPGYDEDTWKLEEIEKELSEAKKYQENKISTTKQKEFPLLKKHGLDKDEKFRYMMLSRMQSDADYYLGNGNKNAKNLWAKDEEEHIGLMKELYDSVSEKPDWLSQEQLNKYEKELSYEKYKRNSIYTDKNGAKIGHSMVVQYATMNHLTIEEAKRILGVK